MTILEIAKLADTSIATVSRYFNNGYVSKETQKRIEAVIEYTGYRPDPIARALNNKSTSSVGLIVPSISNTFFPELAASTEKVLAEKGFKLILCNANNSVDRELSFIDMMQSFRADGIITATGNDLSLYNTCGLPVIAVDRYIDNAAGFVKSANYEGGQIGVQHLYQCGCKKILFVREPMGHYTLKERLEGASNQADNYEDCTFDVLTMGIEPSQQELYAALERFLQYDAIFAWNDIIALHIMNACLSNQIRIPKDIQILGFDNTMVSSLIVPRLSTVAQDITGMGSISAEMLIELVNHGHVRKNEEVLETKLIIRDTTNNPKNIQVQT